jgi:hypothetical protein
MFVRLAFAVAISVDPDILVVDEALSVGDGKFQLKCYAWLQGLRQSGVTVLLVSHDESTVTSLCDKVLIIEAGEVFRQGEPRAMTAAYHQLLFGNAEATSKAGRPRRSSGDDRPVPPGIQARPDGNSPKRYGTGEARIVAWGMMDASGCVCSVIESGAPFRLFISLEFVSDIRDVSFGFAIKDRRGTVLWGVTNTSQGKSAHNGCSGDRVEVYSDGTMWLAGGDYFVTLGAAHLEDGRKIDFIEDAIEFEVTGPGGIFTNSVINMQTSFRIVPSTLRTLDETI